MSGGDCSLETTKKSGFGPGEQFLWTEVPIYKTRLLLTKLDKRKRLVESDCGKGSSSRKREEKFRAHKRNTGLVKAIVLETRRADDSGGKSHKKEELVSATLPGKLSMNRRKHSPRTIDGS